MTQLLNGKTMEILRQSEEEMLQIKQNYAELLQAFNYNLDLIKERDAELAQQDAEIAQMKQLLKRYKALDLVEDKLDFAEAQLAGYKEEHQKLVKQSQTQLKYVADLLQEKERHMYEIQRLSILHATAQTSLENVQAQLTEANARLLELSKDKTNRVADYSALRQENESAKQIREGLQERIDKLTELNGALQKYILGFNSQVFELKQDNQRLGIEYMKARENCKHLYQQLDSSKEEQNEFLKEVKRRHKEIKQANKQLEHENYALQQKVHQKDTDFELVAQQHAQKCYNYEQMLAQLEKESAGLRSKCYKLENEIKQIDVYYAGQINQKQANLNVALSERERLAQDCQAYVKQLMTELYAEKLKSAQLFAYLQDLKVDKVRAEKSGEYQLIIGQMRQDFEKAAAKVVQLERQATDKAEEVAALQRSADAMNSEIQKLRKLADELEAKNAKLAAENERISYQLLIKQADALTTQDLGIIERLKVKLREASYSLKDLSAASEESERNCLIYKEKYMQLLEQCRGGIIPKGQPPPIPPPVPAVEDALPRNFGTQREAQLEDDFPSQLTFDNSLREGMQEILKRAGVY